MLEWIDVLLASWSLVYSLECHSLLKQCFQKGHSTESAQWEPLQLIYLNECGHSLPFLVSSLGGLSLLLALQHYAKSRWLSVRCGPLHLVHLESWIWQTPVVCPYFQQFLHWGAPGFMLVSLTIVMILPTLNHLLMIFFALLLFYVSQISIQTIATSDLGETLMTLSLDARTILLKMWLFLRIRSIFSEEMHMFNLLTKYEIPTILR